MTTETKSIIDQRIDDMLNEVQASIYIGLCETMSPNDPEFDILEISIQEEVSEYITSEIQKAVGQ